jgi:hypothetical protein
MPDFANPLTVNAGFEVFCIEEVGVNVLNGGTVSSSV